MTSTLPRHLGSGGWAWHCAISPSTRATACPPSWAPSHESGHRAGAEPRGRQADVRPGQPAERLRWGFPFTSRSPAPKPGLVSPAWILQNLSVFAELRYSTFHPLEGTGCLPSVGWGSASSSEDQESACGASGLARQERGLVPPRRSVPSGLTQLSSSRGRVRAALKLTASKRDENEETTLKCHFFPFRLAKFKA